MQVNQRMSAERLQQLLADEKGVSAGLRSEVEALRAALQAAGVALPASIFPASGQLSATGNGDDSGGGSTGSSSGPGSSAGMAGQQAVTKSAYKQQLTDGMAAQIADLVALAVMLLSVMLYFVYEDSRRAAALAY